MQKPGTTDANACEYNDFALVKVDPAYVGDVNPSVPFWGGPDALDTDGTTAGENVFSYGNSSLRGGVEALSPKQGTSLGTAGGGWTHPVYTVTPGVPGDSGSAFLDADGKALGTLSTLAIAPLPASQRRRRPEPRARRSRRPTPGIAGLPLVPGTEPFIAAPLTRAGPTARPRPPCRTGPGRPVWRRMTMRTFTLRAAARAPPRDLATVVAPGRPLPSPRPAGRRPTSAKITPGVQMYTPGAQCTGELRLHRPPGPRLRRLRRALCREGRADRHGLRHRLAAARHPVRFDERRHSRRRRRPTVGSGRLVYSSWLTMQRLGDTKGPTCDYNDFALVRVAGRRRQGEPVGAVLRRPHRCADPGSPSATRSTATATPPCGPALTETSPKVGISTGDHPSGWSHDVYTVSPGVPGDSGSGFLDASAGPSARCRRSRSPLPASNGVGDLARELAYAQQHSGIRGSASSTAPSRSARRSAESLRTRDPPLASGAVDARGVRRGGPVARRAGPARSHDDVRRGGRRPRPGVRVRSAA